MKVETLFHNAYRTARLVTANFQMKGMRGLGTVKDRAVELEWKEFW
jgi:hypothetical protein